MHLGLKDTHWVTEIKDAYAAARRSNAYHLGSYCMANADGTSARTESLCAHTSESLTRDGMSRSWLVCLQSTGRR